MQTFLPAGASELAQNNWLVHLAGGLAGARAAPESALPAPGAPPGGGGGGGKLADTVHGVHIENLNTTSNPYSVANEVARHTNIQKHGGGDHRTASGGPKTS